MASSRGTELAISQDHHVLSTDSQTSQPLSAGNGAVVAGASLRPPVNRTAGGAPMYSCTAAAQN